MSFNSVEGFELANGLRRAGVVVVPVNYRLRGPEIAYVLNDSGAKVVVAGPDHVEAVVAASREGNGDVRYVGLGDPVPEGWLSSRTPMRAAAAHQPPPEVGDGPPRTRIHASATP